jgi:hypothetical protein
MAESLTNGTTYPAPRPPDPAHPLTELIQHLDLKDMMLERGTSGLHRAGGFVKEDLLVELTGLEGVRRYKDMRDNSAVVGACLYAIEMRLRNVRWRLTPVNTSDEAQHYATLAEGMLFEDLDQPWSLLLSEILSFLPFGWSWFEMVLKRRQGLHPPPLPDGTPALPSKFTDGYVGLGKVAPRSQDTLLRWEFDATGSLLGMHQLDPWMGRQAYLPYEKSLLFRPTSYKQSPEGRSILRTAYRAWYMVKNIENTEAIGAERDLAGLPVFGTPPQWWLSSASPEEVAQLELVRRIGRNIRQDEQACLVYPLIYDAAGNQLFTFELAHSGGAKAMDTDTIIQRYELRITQSMLCDLLFMGHEDVGSFALASSKSTTEAVSLGGYLAVITDEFNRRCLPLLWRLNGFPEKFLPTLAHGDVETLDLTELARFMLSFGRIFNMQDLENPLRAMAGLPEREGAETHPLPASIQPHPGGGSGGSSSHGGGSGTDIQNLGTGMGMGDVGLPDLDRDLAPQSLSLSMETPPTPVQKAPPRRRRAARTSY